MRLFAYQPTYWLSISPCALPLTSTNIRYSLILTDQPRSSTIIYYQPNWTTKWDLCFSKPQAFSIRISLQSLIIMLTTANASARILSKRCLSSSSSTPSKLWNVYLSGEIHSDWREVIANGVQKKELPVHLTSPNTSHEDSDDCGKIWICRVLVYVYLTYKHWSNLCILIVWCRCHHIGDGRKETKLGQDWCEHE